jgi:DNA-binding XRE family transcriptional regulator
MASRSRARGLGAELRKLRNEAGLTIVDLGNQVGLSKSTVARIETGEKVPDDTEIKTILGALGVTGARRDAVLEAGKEAHRSNWLATGAVGLPHQLMTLVDFEVTAKKITHVNLALVPGLLQTRDYAHAVFVGTSVPPGEIDTRVAIRRGRQEILTRPNPVEYLAILDESALRRPVGGPKAITAQLRHILTMGEHSNITVQVLPTQLGAHAAIGGSYVLHEFANESPVVHLEQYRTGTFLDQREDVEAYGLLTERVRQQALSPAESAGLISDCIADMESTG